MSGSGGGTDLLGGRSDFSVLTHLRRSDTGPLCCNYSRALLVFHIGQIDLDQTSVSTPALRTQMFLGFNQYKICWRTLMKKLAIIGLTLIGSTMLCAVPLSLHFSQATVVSVALDTADAPGGRAG